MSARVASAAEDGTGVRVVGDDWPPDPDDGAGDVLAGRVFPHDAGEDGGIRAVVSRAPLQFGVAELTPREALERIGQ